MRHSFKSPRHIHMVTLPSGRVIKTDYDITEDEELGAFDVLSEGTKLVKSGAAGSKPKKALEAASKGAATGAVVGSIVPGVGTVVGAGVGALVGGMSSLLGGGSKGTDFCGKKLPGKFFDKMKKLGNGIITGNISKKEFALKVKQMIIDVNVQRGIIPEGTTIEDIESGRVVPFCGVKDSEPASEQASEQASKPAKRLSKKQVKSALKSVLSAISKKRRAKKRLVSDIAKKTKPQIKSIKKMVLRDALSRQATSEHNKRTKENAIVNRNNRKQNIMLNRLSAIEVTLKMKQAKGKAIATAFGIPENYV